MSLPRRSRSRIVGSRSRSQHGGGIAEFGPALFIFLLMLLFPLLDLLAVAMGTASVTFLARDAIGRASTGSTYGQSLQLAGQEAQTVINSGIGRFLNLRPQNGYVYNGNPTGMNLYVIAITGGSRTTYGPNGTNMVPASALATPSAISNSIWEYSGTFTFQVGPWVNLHAMPFIGNVPGIGAPFTIQTTDTVAVEHPEGLSDSTIPATN